MPLTATRGRQEQRRPGHLCTKGKAGLRSLRSCPSSPNSNPPSHIHLHQPVPFLRTSAHISTHPARTHFSHSDSCLTSRQKSPLPTISMRGRAPPEVCTAPWRPPTQLESLGSPLPAGPRGPAGPTVAAAPHLPRVGGESSFRGTVRTSLPVPESPRRPCLLLCSKACLQRGGGPDPTWPAVPSTSHWAISCHY